MRISTTPCAASFPGSSRRAYDRVLGYIAGGVAEGAMLAIGGKRPDDPALAHGHFLLPAVFTGVTHDMMIAREEIFGPVLAVLRWEDEARVLAQVNDTEYGLTASIWTNDLTAAHRLAAHRGRLCMDQ
jgi:acyl-CoA reductase-like NAD-dependent aldehyde dehydrogenase